MLLGNGQLWQLAIAWTRSNKVLIKCIATQYFPYMGCSAYDLQAEALLVAHQTVVTLLQKDKGLDLMGRYFRIVFRSRCIELMDVCVAADVDLSDVTLEELGSQNKLDQYVIESALSDLTNRQRQIAQWILTQPTPASTNMIGLKFGITARGVRKLISNAIFRIENGNQRICKSV